MFTWYYLFMLNEELVSLFPGHPKHSSRLEVSFKKKADDRLIAELVRSIDDRMEKLLVLGLDGIVIGLSGGVDSGIACSLAMKAKSSASAIIVELDDESNLTNQTTSAIELAKKVGIQHEVVNATRVYQEQLGLFRSNPTLTRVHLRSRVINTTILQYADNRSAIAIDSTDKSEEILKIYEESFRGHLAPLIGLYKSELYDIADLLSLPELRDARSGCPELVDFDAFGMEWEDLDTLLFLLVDQGRSVHEIAGTYGVDTKWLGSLYDRISSQPLRTTRFEVVLRGEQACGT